MFFLLFLPVAVFAQCSDVCYPNVECFTNCYPFESFPHPQSPDDIGTQFYLYSRTGDDIVNEGNINTSPAFSSGRSATIFVIHGFSESSSTAWMQSMRSNLLQNGDYNVILVDWRRGALPSFPDPTAPVPGSNTRVVARVARNLIRATNGLLLDRVQCIGFSLGAHACGFLGKEFGGVIRRVSGLDPAGDIFTNCGDSSACCANNACRMSANDALFVDAIHTNAWGTAVSSGITHNVAMVDFWPNKGESQPGCGADVTGICSHERSTSLYIESINSNCGFTSNRCNSLDDMRNDNCPSCSGSNCQQMGYKSINNSGRGTYVLSTNGQSPFCQN